jgi:hypothetical protein
MAEQHDEVRVVLAWIKPGCLRFPLAMSQDMVLYRHRAELDPFSAGNGNHAAQPGGPYAVMNVVIVIALCLVIVFI